jgi:hypothetical protein
MPMRAPECAGTEFATGTEQNRSTANPSDSSGGRPSEDVELAILLAASKVPLRGDVVQLPDCQVNWDRLLHMAGAHALTPLLKSYLEQFPHQFVPRSVFQSLEKSVTAGALHNLLLASELLTISRHLRSRRIEHLAYKGPLLAADLFGGLDRRLSSDLDIVVPRHKLKQACMALAELGFKDKNSFNSSQLAASFRYGFEHTFTRGEVAIDLHWRLAPAYVAPTLDEAGIWQRSREAPFFGQTIPTFCPEDLLFALCLHAGGHDWLEISLFCDIALLLRDSHLNWEIVLSHLGDSNTRRIVFISLALTQKHWHAALPPEIDHRIAADSQVPGIVAAIERELWPRIESEPIKSIPLGWLLRRTKGEAIGERLRHVGGVTLNPTLIDFERFRLPRPLIPLYPLLRGARLACKYGRKALAKDRARQL